MRTKSAEAWSLTTFTHWRCSPKRKTYLLDSLLFRCGRQVWDRQNYKCRSCVQEQQQCWKIFTETPIETESLTDHDEAWQPWPQNGRTTRRYNDFDDRPKSSPCWEDSVGFYHHQPTQGCCSETTFPRSLQINAFISEMIIRISEFCTDSSIWKIFDVNREIWGEKKRRKSRKLPRRKVSLNGSQL